MSENNQSAEVPVVTNPFVTNEAMLPAEPIDTKRFKRGAATGAVAVVDLGPVSDDGKILTQSPPATAPDPWAEPQPVAIPASGRKMKWSYVIILALMAVVVWLGVRQHSVQGKLGEVKAQWTQSQSKNGELQVQIDGIAKPAGAGGGAGAGELRIVSATFGSGENFRDVTDRLSELLSHPDAGFSAVPDALKADPTPGWKKTLIVAYIYHGSRHQFSCGEGGQVSVAILVKAAM